MERLGILDYLRGAMVPAACLVVIAYFAYHAIEGGTGLLAWGGYKAERTKLEGEVQSLKARKAELDRRIALLNPRKVDPDYADELVRGNLGVVRPDEVVIQLHKAK